MKLRWITSNAVVAGLYAAISLLLPSFRFSSALYMLAAFDPTLIPGLAIGNAAASVHHRPLDLIEGVAVGWITSWLCAKVGPRWSPAVVAVVPTLLVSLWLTLVVGRAFIAVLPMIFVGQLTAAVVGAVVVVPLGKRLGKLGILGRPAASGR
jgi:uncharacterized membrane protein